MSIQLEEMTGKSFEKNAEKSEEKSGEAETIDMPWFFSILDSASYLVCRDREDLDHMLLLVAAVAGETVDETASPPAPLLADELLGATTTVCHRCLLARSQAT